MNTFPILRSDYMASIPFAMIEPHRKQAHTNHGQTLERLAERGGLSISEALAVLEDRHWRHDASTPEDAARLLINKVREWRASAIPKE